MKARHKLLLQRRRGPLPPFWIGFFSIFDITGQWTLRELDIRRKDGPR